MIDRHCAGAGYQLGSTDERGPGRERPFAAVESYSLGAYSYIAPSSCFGNRSKSSVGYASTDRGCLWRCGGVKGRPSRDSQRTGKANPKVLFNSRWHDSVGPSAPVESKPPNQQLTTRRQNRRKVSPQPTPGAGTGRSDLVPVWDKRNVISFAIFAG